MSELPVFHEWRLSLLGPDGSDEGSNTGSEAVLSKAQTEVLESARRYRQAGDGAIQRRDYLLADDQYRHAIEPWEAVLVPAPQDHSLTSKWIAPPTCGIVPTDSASYFPFVNDAGAVFRSVRGWLSAADNSEVSKCKSFARALGYSVLQEPYDGISQLLNHFNFSIGSHHFVDKPIQSDGCVTAGKFVGLLVKFWLVNRVIGKLTGIGELRATSTVKGEALKMGITGSTVEALAPISEDGNFARRKAVSIAEAFGSFAVFGKVNGRANELGLFGRAGFRSYLGDSAVYGLSGAASGITGAELHALLTDGRLASRTEVQSTVVSHAALGLGLAAFGRLAPRQEIKLEAATNGFKTSTVSTEEWVAQHYDGKSEIRSQILTWLAEHKPELRPPNYSQLRAQAWCEGNKHVDLSLGDWAPDQRLAVVAELRRLSQKELATDSNIDAFISRFARSELQGLASSYCKAAQPVRQAIDAVERELVKHPAFASTSRTELLYDPAIEEQLRAPGYETLKAELDNLRRLFHLEYLLPEELALRQSMQREFDVLAKDSSLPPIEVFVGSDANAQWTQNYLILGMGTKPAISAETLERAYHEFTHHTQGLLYGKETLTYMAKQPFYMLSRKLGLLDTIHSMQEVTSRSQFINSYVGSSKEKQAFATGLLVRIRALAAGIPME